MSVPPLPPRPARTMPEAPCVIYDDINEKNTVIQPNSEDEYDDFEVTSPPPVPPHPEIEQEDYDDLDMESSTPPPPPQRPKPSPLMTTPTHAPQDDDPGPIVQQLHKRPRQPPTTTTTPASTHTAVRAVPVHTVESIYELGNDNDDLPSSGQGQLDFPPPPPSMEENVYEAEPCIENEHAFRPPPLAPTQSLKTPSLPPQPSPDTDVPPPPPGRQRPHAEKVPVTSPKGTAPGILMKLDQLQDARGKLRRVSQDSGTLETSTSHDPKDYAHCPDNVHDAKQKFESKAGGKPVVQSSKPQVAQKPDTSQSSRAVGSTVGSHTVTKNISPPCTPSTLKPQQAVRPVSRSDPQTLQLEDQEVYDDASSMALDPLLRYDWYHGNISRSVGDQQVKAINKDGAFLVRVSDKDPGYPFTLVVFHKGAVSNMRIRKRADGKVALGDEKIGEMAFKDVPAMIEYHRIHHVLLLGSSHSQVKLQHIAPKN